MDKNTIFCKTSEGEEAVRQRTRLVQRNLRIILIMVDGHSTVSALEERFEDAAVVVGALEELEQSGFIKRLQQEGPAPAEQPAAALADAPARPAPESAPDEVPVLTAQAPATPAKIQQPIPQPQPVVENIVISAPDDALEWSSQQFEPEPPKKPAKAARKAGPSWIDSLTGVIEGARKKLAERPKKTRAEPYEEDETILPVTIKPLPRTVGARFGWPWLAAMALVGIVVVLVLVALLFPYGNYLPDIEQQASAALHDPVKIKRIGFSFLPRPNITLEGIEVGKDRYLAIGTIRVVPELLSLLREKKVLREVDLDHVTISSQGLGRIGQWGGGGGAGAVEIRQVNLSALSLGIGDATFDGIGGEIQMGPANAPGKIQLHNADSTLTLDVQPNAGNYKIAISGKAWKTPFNPSLLFDNLDAQGELGASRFTLSKFEGRLYEGSISGTGSIDWTRGAALAGDVELKRISLPRLLPALGTDFTAEGDVSSTIRLESRADALGKLMDGLRAEASFDVKRGAVKGFDLGEAVRSMGRSPTRGGATKFEQFSGNLALEQQAYRLTNLRISSGLMKAGGYLNVGKDKRLNGVMEVEVKGSAALIKAPVAISGTTKEPQLMPTKGSMAGAALGTALLGPGFGTSLGAKAGAAVEGMTGKR
jgi:hypothetical protein